MSEFEFESKSEQAYLKQAGDPAELDAGIQSMDIKFRGCLLLTVAFVVIRFINLIYADDGYVADEFSPTLWDTLAIVLLLVMTFVFWIRLHLLRVLKAALTVSQR